MAPLCSPAKVLLALTTLLTLTSANPIIAPRAPFLNTTIWPSSVRHSASEPSPIAIAVPQRSPVPPHPVSGIGEFVPTHIEKWENGDVEEEVALCLAIKDEYHDLAEWLVHHYNHHAIRRFYIMDDGSHPKMSEYEYESFVDPSTITHIYMDPEERPVHGQQHAIYQKCVEEFGDKHTWMGFLDTDEFLEVRGEETLHSILKELEDKEDVGALAINWLNHNSAGLEHRPHGKGLRETFIQCLDDEVEINGGGNAFTKPFVKTAAWRGAGYVHRMELADGMHTVGEKGDIMHDWMFRYRPVDEVTEGSDGGEGRPGSRDRILLHHYATRSKGEYKVKLSRGDVMFEKLLRGEIYWEDMEAAMTWECMSMIEYSIKDRS